MVRCAGQIEDADIVVGHVPQLIIQLLAEGGSGYVLHGTGDDLETISFGDGGHLIAFPLDVDRRHVGLAFELVPTHLGDEQSLEVIRLDILIEYISSHGVCLFLKVYDSCCKPIEQMMDGSFLRLGSSSTRQKQPSFRISKMVSTISSALLLLRSMRPNVLFALSNRGKL